MSADDTLTEIQQSLKPKPVTTVVDAQVVELQEKLRVALAQLDAVKDAMKPIGDLVDELMRRSREITYGESILYQRLSEVLPRVVADMKK